MAHTHNILWRIANAARWTARVAGGLMVLFLLAFVVGEGAPPVWRMTLREQMYAAGMGALFGGLALAWFRPGWGGLVTLAGWVGLGTLAGRPAWDLPLLIPGVLGLAHVGCWWAMRALAPPETPLGTLAAARLRWLVRGLWAALGLFVVLSANEMFGHPPLMTPGGTAELTGAWRGEAGGREALLVIGADGGVTGSVGGVALPRLRAERNRSWFGRLMHWRSDYRLKGAEREGGAWLDERDGGLQGTLALERGRSLRVKLMKQ